MPFGGAPTLNAENGPETKLASALELYKESILAKLGKTLDEAQEQTVDQRIFELRVRFATVSDQTSAFTQLTNLILDSVGGDLEPAQALDLRTDAREAMGLSLFPAMGSTSQTNATVPLALGDNAPRLLDVDFVAVYW